jgi:hypothetical protein
LGVLVIEFRDTTGKISASFPSHRELEAYRAAVLYGIGLPSMFSPIGQSAESLLKARPALAPLQEAPIPRAERVRVVDTEGRGVDRVA